MTRPPSPRAPSAARGAASWFGSVLAWMLLLLLLAVVLSAIAVPRFAGATPYAVLSSSMEPRYPPGTLLVVRSVPPETLAIGDVITYQLRSGQPEVVSHRITAITYGAGDEMSFRTRGDHNPVADPDPVRAVQVRGELWYAVPLLGHLTIWLGGPTRLLVTAAVVVLLVGYAGALFASAWRDRRKRPPDPVGVRAR